MQLSHSLPLLSSRSVRQQPPLTIAACTYKAIKLWRGRVQMNRPIEGQLLST